jgi:hypothetical protein
LINNSRNSFFLKFTKQINNFLVMNGKRTTETEKEREERKAWSTSKTGHTVWTRPDGLGRPTLGTAWDNKRQKFNNPDRA